jgi:spore coat polysaccharide biosynthesis protein SpsF
MRLDMSAVVSIQARLGSTRLPGKVLLHLGNRRILEWVVERAVSAATESFDTIVAIGNQPENKAIIELCERSNLDYVQGPEEDLLARHLQVARSGDYDTLVRITADCPFVPPSEIDRVVEYHHSNGANYTTNRTEEMPIGTAVDVIEQSILNRLAADNATHPIRPVLDNPEDWEVAISGSDRWETYGGAHTAVDTPTDYWELTDAVNAVGGNPKEVTRWVAGSGFE